MKYTDLIEYDPEIGRAIGQAAAGIYGAGVGLKDPINLTKMQQKVATKIDDLERDIKANPKQDFAKTFNDFLNKEKKAAKITKDLGLKYDTNKLKTRDGSYNSAYIRKVLGKFYSILSQQMPVGTVKKGSDGQRYKWVGAQWQDAKGKMRGPNLP